MGENPDSYKIVLLGQSGVGKTSIITQFIDENFTDDQQSTTGATFSSKDIQCSNGRLLKFDIWDTAGQEKYRSLTKMFYKDAAAAILVYDITRKDSFDEIRNYWAEQIKEHSPKKIVIALAANKSDLYEEEKVPEEEGRTLATEIGALFASTSAKNQQGIEDLFNSIGNKLCDPAWEQGQEVLKEAKRKTVTITKSDQQKKQGVKKGCC